MAKTWERTIVKPGQVWQLEGIPDEYEVIRINLDKLEVYVKRLPNNTESMFGHVLADGTPNKWDNGWHMIREAPHSPGMFCALCSNFFPMAVPNRPSKKLVCWSCRQGWVPPDT